MFSWFHVLRDANCWSHGRETETTNYDGLYEYITYCNTLNSDIGTIAWPDLFFTPGSGIIARDPSVKVKRGQKERRKLQLSGGVFSRSYEGLSMVAYVGLSMAQELPEATTWVSVFMRHVGH